MKYVLLVIVMLLVGCNVTSTPSPPPIIHQIILAADPNAKLLADEYISSSIMIFKSGTNLFLVRYSGSQVWEVRKID